MDERQELYENVIMYLMSENVYVDDIKDGLYAVLSDYEIQDRCTDVALVHADRNEYLIKKFLVAKTVKGCTKRTIEFYGTELRRIIERIGKTVDDITTDDIRYYIAIRVKRDKVSKVTADNDLRVLRTFFSYLQAEEIVLKNPMAHVDRIKVQKMKKEALTEMETEMLRTEAAKDDRNLALYEVMLSTGARVSEIANIKLDEIEGNRILVHGKGEKDRYVYLNARAELAVNRYINERNDMNPYLFPGGISASKIHYSRKEREWWKKARYVNDTHIETSTIESTMRKLADRSGVERANPHKLRRTCATMALRRGMPIEQVSKMLGHESIQTTQIYLDLNEEDLKIAHKKYVV